MIDREDMMELTRRMTVKRTSFTRAAGCYLDRDGEPDGVYTVVSDDDELVAVAGVFESMLEDVEFERE